MGDRSRGQRKSLTEKHAKPRKGGLRPHEQRQQDAASNQPSAVRR
jgi:hypothetical protein